jgi:hypothetical protein
MNNIQGDICLFMTLKGYHTIFVLFLFLYCGAFIVYHPRVVSDRIRCGHYPLGVEGYTTGFVTADATRYLSVSTMSPMSVRRWENT